MKIKKNKISLGSWITLPSNDVVEIMCKAGFDWLAVDMEHSAISESQAQDLLRIINLSGLMPYVRVPDNSRSIIKKVLDMGASGIIVPNVNSIDDVNQAYDSINYPPLGKRGVGLARAQGYGNNFKEYLEWQKNNIKLVIQIEDIKAIPNLDEIFATKKIDSFFIGPYDLSGSLGIPGDFENPLFKKTVNKILSKADKYKIKKGIHVIEPNIKELNKVINKGFSFIAYSLDVRILDVKAREINSLKKNYN
tara:strand:+ start:722 stop:1471 length:750 start_codon:yes stop_codon:yes gene_type:complete